MPSWVSSAYQRIRGFQRRLQDDAVSAYAAQSALFLIISFFPFLMLMLTLLPLFPFLADASDLLAIDVIPQALRSSFHDLTDGITPIGGTIISISAVTALWSASKGIFAVVRGLNTIYRQPETRRFLPLRLLATLYTLAFIVILIAVLGVLVFGGTLYDWIVMQFPAIKHLAFLIISIRLAASFAILALFFTLFYTIVPNRHFATFFTELPGALIAAFGWIIFSYLYSFYIEHISSATVYGSLTAVVLLLLWLYFCMYILFIGAEFNCLIQDIPIVRKRLVQRREAQIGRAHV